MRQKFTAACAAALLLMGTSAYAQQPTANDEADTTCDFTFLSGAGAKALHYCVSRHGNLMRFESPAGQEHIRLGAFLEGYAVCSDSPALNTVHGYDGGSAGESAWGALGAPAVSATGVTVFRNTADGRLQLQMKFSKDSLEKDVTIQTTIVNLTGSTLTNVKLSRYVDFDRAFNWSSALDSIASMDQANWGTSFNATSSEVPHSNQVETFGNLSASAGSCAAAAPLATPNTGDLTARITYNVGNITGGGKKIVRHTVRRQ